MATVLLVDDDRALRKLLRAYLEEESITVVESGTGEQALATVERVRPELVLLDVRLPGIDGFEVLRRLSIQPPGPAVMLVTSLEDDVDQLVAYRLGAIDFVTKPVSPRLLSAKVKAFLTRMTGVAAASRTECGPLVLEHDARRALVDGNEVPLTRRELELLVALAAHPGWVMPRERLLADVWGIDADLIETRLVDQHVANLRRKLAAAGADGLVQTVRGLGYRLAPPSS